MAIFHTRGYTIAPTAPPEALGRSSAGCRRGDRASAQAATLRADQLGVAVEQWMDRDIDR